MFSKLIFLFIIANIGYLIYRAVIIKRPAKAYSINQQSLIFGGYSGLANSICGERATPSQLSIPLVDVHRVKDFKFRKFYGNRFGDPYHRFSGTVIRGKYFEISFAGQLTDSEKNQCEKQLKGETVLADEHPLKNLDADAYFTMSWAYRINNMIEVFFSYGSTIICFWLLMHRVEFGFLYGLVLANVFLYNVFYFPKNLLVFLVANDMFAHLKGAKLIFHQSSRHLILKYLPRLALPQEEIDLRQLIKVRYSPYNGKRWSRFRRYHLYASYELILRDSEDGRKRKKYQFNAIYDESGDLFKLLFLVAQHNHYSRLR